MGLDNLKKSYLSRLIVFFLIFDILFVGISYVLRQDNDLKKRFAGFYNCEEGSLDVVYIGASPVHPYWAAPLAWNEYGFTSWPLATNVQQPKVIKVLLDEVLKTQVPKVVVIELRMFSRHQSEFDEFIEKEGATRNVTDNVKYSFNKIRIVNLLIDNIEERHLYLFDIIKYHSLWKHLEEKDWQYWDFEKEDINGGHLVSGDVVNLSGQDQDFSSVIESRKMPAEQEIILRDLLDYCKKHDIVLLCTVNPYTAINAEVQEMFNYMKEIIVDEYGYDYINFNNLYDELNVNFASDFYNASHMNACGAVKFTRYLANYLVENYDLKDKRGGYRIFR